MHGYSKCDILMCASLVLGSSTGSRSFSATRSTT